MSARTFIPEYDGNEHLYNKPAFQDCYDLLEIIENERKRRRRWLNLRYTVATILFMAFLLWISKHW